MCMFQPKFGVGKAGGFVKPTLIHSESVTSEYLTIADFSDGVGDGISFKAGQHVKVNNSFCFRNMKKY